MFTTVSEGLAQAGCAKAARVVVEKPFGRDLASAQELNRTLHRFFPESAIFRIDHYLGKEPVQNLIYFRFANPLIEAGWNNEHLESVQITMAERFGVAGRGKLYEEVGAIRDVVQNHMLQVIACLAMGCPPATTTRPCATSAARLLRAVRTLRPADIVRGQFRGYRQEPGVAADSQVETYAAVRVPDRQRPLGGRAVLRPRRQVPARHGDRGAGPLQAPRSGRCSTKPGRRWPITTASGCARDGAWPWARRSSGRATAWWANGWNWWPTTSLPTRWSPTSGSWAAAATATRRSSPGKMRSRPPGGSSIRSSATQRRFSSTSRDLGAARGRPTSRPG